MRKSLIAAALAIGTLIAPAAQAALVTQWDWTVTSVWDAPATTFTTGTAPDGPGTTITSPSTISWGATGGDHTDTTAAPLDARSALVITNSPASSPPTMVTNSLIPVATNIFTHYNNIIDFDFATLVTAKLDTTLQLQPNTPPGPLFPPDTISFSIRFIETLNQEECFASSLSTCDDIFVIELGDLSQQFFYDGFTYQVDIVNLLGGGLVQFLTLSDSACLEAGALSGCVGLQTLEAQRNDVQFGLLISTVPEPGILALMGLGLLGLVVTRRRRMI